MGHQDPPYSVLPVKIVLVHQYLRLGIGILVIRIAAKFIDISFNIEKSKGQDAILCGTFYWNSTNFVILALNVGFSVKFSGVHCDFFIRSTCCGTESRRISALIIACLALGYWSHARGMSSF